jgi:hypothetical protein
MSLPLADPSCITNSVVLFIIPPSGGLFEYILGAISIFVGICLAWAWGVITLKAALAARPEAETQALLMSMQEAISIQAQNTGESPSIISQRLIFDGWMLDTRVTVIIYCMLCPFVYFMVLQPPPSICGCLTPS